MWMATSTSAAQRARWAVTAVFGGSGLMIASFAVRTPSLKLDLGLSPGQLGLVSALFGVSAVIAMQSTGRLVARAGSGRIVRVVTALLPIALVGVGLAPGWAALIPTLVVFGTLHGTLDVTMNTHAVEVERVLGRHVMHGCHAAWSIGAVAGSLLGAGAAAIELARGWHYAILAALIVPVALACGRMLLPTRVDRRPVGAAKLRGRSTLLSGWLSGWTRDVLGYGAMGATVLTVEAAVAGWSGVFLHEDLGAALGVAALGYVAFAGCQTAGRLVGDRLQARLSAARLIRMGTLAATCGLAVVVIGPSPAFGVVGFAIMGLGLATPLPVLFGVVGHLGASRGAGRADGAATMVSRFTTMTFTGILIAPAIIGWVAELIGLTWTLAALLPLLLAVVYGAGNVARHGRPEAPDTWTAPGVHRESARSSS